jgi:hypothetical protein
MAWRGGQDIWRPLGEEIEGRWRGRVGDVELDCLPILHYGLTPTSVGEETEERDGTQASLLALVSKLLMAFALEYDRQSGVSLAISANVWRVVGDDGARVRDLP